jgi:hypothetical protein
MAMKAATHVPTSLVRATGSGLPVSFPDGGVFVEGPTPIATVPDIFKRLQIGCWGLTQWREVWGGEDQASAPG